MLSSLWDQAALCHLGRRSKITVWNTETNHWSLWGLCLMTTLWAKVHLHLYLLLFLLLLLGSKLVQSFTLFHVNSPVHRWSSLLIVKNEDQTLHQIVHLQPHFMMMATHAVLLQHLRTASKTFLQVVIIVVASHSFSAHLNWLHLCYSTIKRRPWYLPHHHTPYQVGSLGLRPQRKSFLLQCLTSSWLLPLSYSRWSSSIFPSW